MTKPASAAATSAAPCPSLFSDSGGLAQNLVEAYPDGPRTRPSAAQPACRLRTSSSSRCRTPARRNGIARIRPGSSSNSCSAEHCRLPAVRHRLRLPVQFLLRHRRPTSRAPAARASTRPNADEVTAYRAHVDAAVEKLIDDAGEDALTGDRADGRDRTQPRAAASGTDAHRHPARLRAEPDQSRLRSELELPRRRTRARAMAITLPRAFTPSAMPAKAFASTTKARASRAGRPGRIARNLVTNGEWLDFMQDGGYTTPTLWLIGRLGRGAERRLAGARPLAARSTAHGTS